MIKAVNMRTCLLLLYAQFAFGIIAGQIIWSECPTNCSCTENSDATSLDVDCHGHPDASGELSEQIESLLSDGLVYRSLYWLTIINTPLANVSRSVCRLMTLGELHLDSNQLRRLPDNCLTNLSNLEQLTAADNAIETLQDGIFDGMRKLQYLDLSRNRISSIGLSVFAMPSNLSSLFTIILSENNLTSLEPWVYDRAITASVDRPVYIDLAHNQISKFTNNGNYACQKIIPYAHFDFRYNHIKHFMDILNGWQVDFIRCYLMILNDLAKGIYNFMLLLDDSIACDCVDFHFFSLLPFQDLFIGNPSWRIQQLGTIIDPVTRKSSIVDGFDTDLSLFVCELTERCPAGCVCVHRPANDTLHVYCSNKNLLVLPLELPEFPDNRTKYKLDFSNNKLLRRLEHRDYFVNTSVLDLSDCSVDDVSDWEDIVKITDLINLSGNNITSLQPSFMSIYITSRKLNLANNLWDCSCDNKWM